MFILCVFFGVFLGLVLTVMGLWAGYGKGILLDIAQMPALPVQDTVFNV